MGYAGTRYAGSLSATRRWICSTVAATALTTPPAADVLASLIKVTATRIIAPLVGELAATRSLYDTAALPNLNRSARGLVTPLHPVGRPTIVRQFVRMGLYLHHAGHFDISLKGRALPRTRIRLSRFTIRGESCEY